MYELGLIVKGIRYTLYKGKEYPENQHEMLWATAALLRKLFPNEQVQSFQEWNGQGYSI